MPISVQTKKISIVLVLGFILFVLMISFFTIQQSLMVSSIILMVTVANISWIDAR